MEAPPLRAGGVTTVKDVLRELGVRLKLRLHERDARRTIAQHCLRGARDCAYAVEQMLLLLRDP